MSLFDTLDGTFMNFAYQWAFSNPVRKVFYNLTITGLSIAVAFFIATMELFGLDLANVGYIIVGLFVVVWVAAVAYWKAARVEQRWGVPTAPQRGAELCRYAAPPRSATGHDDAAADRRPVARPAER